MPTTESLRTDCDLKSKPTSSSVKTIESAPMPRVETVGVRYRGWMRPSAGGTAFHRAIESVVRAVGRIVVCVEADAEVSTAMISSLSHGDPKIFVPRTLRTSLVFVDARKPVPRVRLGGGRDEEVDEQSRISVERTAALPGDSAEPSVSSLTATPESQPQ